MAMNSKDNADCRVCKDMDNCSALKAEREQAVESLKSHLSEQRHDFFNLLQVLYGYTQLKKPDKVLACIKDYCRHMENIGRLYNSKCIKLADLLYTKGKEAESIDMKLEASVEVSFEPVVRQLDRAEVLYVLDHLISGFMYVLDERGCKNAHIVYELKENADYFHMEVYCRELREGQYGPVEFEIPQETMYWKKIDRDLISHDTIIEKYSRKDFKIGMLEDGQTFVLSISKDKKQE